MAKSTATLTDNETGKTYDFPIISGTGPTGDEPMALGVFNLSAIATFPGQPIAVAFDNFHVLADRIVCP